MKFVFTASSISSIAISSTIRFFRFRKMPITAIANSSAPTPRYAGNETIALLPPAPAASAAAAVHGSLAGLGRHPDDPEPIGPADRHLIGRILVSGVLALAQGQRDGRDDSHQQHGARDLQRQQVFGEREPPQRRRVAAARRRSL